jgi:hypothetical protein
MAKDPAFLFYPNDFDAATKFFSDDQVGIYLRLLIAQFQHGRLNEKQVLFISKRYDEDIMEKFIKDENNLYFSERLEFEVVRRKNFSDSRKNNRTGKVKDKEKTDNISLSLDKHMETETETENRNVKKKIKMELPFKNIEFVSKWGEWKQYKRIQHKFTYKSKQTEEASLSQLVKLSENNSEVAIKIIEQSIANGWKGFFNIKNENNGQLTKSVTNNNKSVGVSQLLAKAKRDFETFGNRSEHN